MTDNSFYKAVHKALGKADTHVMHAEFNNLKPDRGLAEVRDLLRSAIANAPASLSPAATPVSEADLDDLLKRARMAALSENTLYGGTAGDLYNDLADAIVALAKPASSPAGGDVRALVDRLSDEASRLDSRAEKNDRAAATSGNPDAAGTFTAWAIMERERAADLRLAIAALSQSTSAGRVGE